MRFFYSFLFMLALPVVFLRLWKKGKKNAGYRQHWGERLGFLPFELNQSIWLHAVSLGEMVAAAPLIEALLNRNPAEKLVLTCMTPTGRCEAEKWSKKFPERVFVAYLPYDFSFAIKRAHASIRPTLLIVMETELWPNLFRFAKVPIIIANARISDRAFTRYQRFIFITRFCLGFVNEVAAQSQLDANRFQSLGAKTVSIMGNIKYDLSQPIQDLQQASFLQASWPKRLIICAGSTHAGEEQLLLQAYLRLKAQFPTLLLILIPRHPERFEQVSQLIQTQGLSYLRYSDSKTLQDEAIFLVDAMGKVKTFYALSNIVFVGGSLIPIGGHNILEAAILGKPILVGPFMQNARQVVQEFLGHDALIQLKTTELADLTNTLQTLLAAPERCNQLGQNAFNMIERNKGALTRLLAVIDSY